MSASSLPWHSGIYALTALVVHILAVILVSSMKPRCLKGEWVKGRYFEIQTYSFPVLHSLILVLKYGLILLILSVSTDFSM